MHNFIISLVGNAVIKNDVNWAIWIPLFIALIAGLWSYINARNSDKITLKKAQEENEINLGKTNNEQSIALFQQYQRMNEMLQEKFDKMQSKLENIEDEFRTFRIETEKEKRILLDQIDDLEEMILEYEENKAKLIKQNLVLEQVHIEDLKTIESLRSEITILKGGIINGNG